MTYQNPIIPGYNPDPSICRVGDDFYLVTSSFEFFPGVPVYHSKNLINWEMIGHCLIRDSQLPLENCPASAGIYAPTIRWHDGVFFMTTTNVSAGGNFIVHAEDPRGPWSEPAWVKQGGIDPSLFWDDDGVCWFTSNGSADEETSGIFLCKIDPFTGEMLTPSLRISEGCGGKHPEAPHIYKKDGWYYLMLAEGGTEYGHTETMQRSRSITGPYAPCPHNPILSHVGACTDPNSNAIQATGHADLVEDGNGNWWLVCLAIRPLMPLLLHNLGRESFLAPVIWNNEGWPVVGNHGRISLEMEGPLPGPVPVPISHDFADDFTGETLNPAWTFVRNPHRENYALRNGSMTLTGTDTTLSRDGGAPTMMGIRQTAFRMDATAALTGVLRPGCKAGLTAYYNHSAHDDIYLTCDHEGYSICLRKRIGDMETITSRPLSSCDGSIRLKIETNRKEYAFFYEENGCWNELGRCLTAYLCTETTCTMTFTGTFLGIFCENGSADFHSFTLRLSNIIRTRF